MISLYLKSIYREIDHLRSLDLSQKKIAERVRKKFQQGIYTKQTANWNLIAQIILETERGKK